MTRGALVLTGAALAVVGLLGVNRPWSTPATSTEPRISSPVTHHAISSQETSAPASYRRTATSEVLPASTAHPESDVEPAVHLSILEMWARSARTNLDTVTYALIDPDESVRARAQELLEETLAR